MEFSSSNHVNSKLHVHLQKDYEQFLNSFEKPAQIYRVLRERFLEQPIFLNRNLSYMRKKDDNPRTVTSRSKFNLAEILDSCPKEGQIIESDLDSDSFLKIEINTFSTTNQSDHQFSEPQVWEISVELKRPVLSPAKFEIIPLEKFSFPAQNSSNSDKEGVLPLLITLPITQIKTQSVSLLQQTSVVFSIKRINSRELSVNSSPELPSTFNQNETSLHSNSLTVKSGGKHGRSGIEHSPTYNSKQKTKYDLNSTTERETLQKLKSNDKKRKQNEPNTSQKRTKMSTPTRPNNRNRSANQKSVVTNSPKTPLQPSRVGKQNKSPKQTSKANENLGKQKTDILLEKIRSLCPKSFNNVVELKLFNNKSEYCLLKRGKYEIYFSLPESENSVVTEAPKFIRYSLSFNINWTHETPTTRNLTDFSTPLKRAIHKHYKFKSMQVTSKREEPIANTPTIYNFIYESNTYQQTQQNSRFECPLCSIICPRDFSLLQHLNSTHPRLDFKYIPSDSLTVVDVRVNSEYDGSFSGDPKELGRQGVALWRYGPIRRKPYSSIIHLSPVGFGRNEDIANFIASYDNDSQQYLGMDRVFFHSRTCHPILPSEINSDSEDDNNEWLLSQSKKLINDFTDVNQQEKEIMKLWNIHIIQSKVVGDCHIAEACITFSEKHAKIIREKSLTNNFLAHLVQLCDQGLITLDLIQDSLSIINALTDS